MLHKFKKFCQLPLEEKKLYLDAYVTLGVIHMAILTLSFKRLTHSLHQSTGKEEITVLNEIEIDTATKVGKAITRAAAYTSWESACLPQSLTVQKMLQNRGIPSVFYLGAAKDDAIKEKIEAHSWSECEDTIITGDIRHERFTVLSVFGWGKEC